MHRVLTVLLASLAASVQGACLEVVIAAYGPILKDMADAIRLAGGTPCADTRVHIYSKDAANDCSMIWRDAGVAGNASAAGVTLVCTDLPNVGREQHTYATHVSTHWDNLGNYLLLLPLPMSDRDANRRAYYEQALSLVSGPANELPYGFYTCSNAGVGHIMDERPRPGSVDEPRAKRLADGDMQFVDPVDSDGHANVRAVPTPLGAWATTHLLLDELSVGAAPLCLEGFAATTRAFVHTHPRSTFANVVAQLGFGDRVEAGHYMERLMLAAYGPHNFTETANDGAAAAETRLRARYIAGGIVGGLLILLAAVCISIMAKNWQASNGERTKLMSGQYHDNLLAAPKARSVVVTTGGGSRPALAIGEKALLQ